VKFLLANYLILYFILASVLKCYWIVLSAFYTCVFWNYFWENIFLLFFPLFFSLFVWSVRTVVLYVRTVWQDIPVSGLDTRFSAGLLCGTLCPDGFSATSERGTLEVKSLSPLRRMILITFSFIFCRLCDFFLAFHMLFSCALVILRFLSTPSLPFFLSLSSFYA
jgi:hypothetical protein